MAAMGKSYFGRGHYRFLSGERDGSVPSVASDHAVFELDESDIWSTTGRSSSPEFRKPVPSSRSGRKAPPPNRGDPVGSGFSPAASSLPVNIPDWSKILKDDYRENQWRNEADDGGDYDDVGDRVPPHEFLASQIARTRIASFSVHEGVGRTLKGRDLKRVRNAIWEKTGFQD